MQLVREMCSILAIFVAILGLVSRTASAFQAATSNSLSSAVGSRRQFAIRSAVPAHGAGCMCSACSPVRHASCSCNACRSGRSYADLFHPDSCTCTICTGVSAHAAACDCALCRGN